MSVFHVLNASQQVAAHLRQELLGRKWTGIMPGGDRLAAELGVGSSTMEAALGQLENEGWLINQGKRGRRISIPEDQAKPALRVAILVVDADDPEKEYILKLQHALIQAGHAPFLAKIRTPAQRMELKYLVRTVERTEADAWIIMSGNQEELQWFLDRQIPAFAMFGVWRQMPMAGGGPMRQEISRQAIRALVQLGHRRIVLIGRSRRFLPEMRPSDLAMLDEMRVHGIPLSGYNTASWDETIPSLQACLVSLFAVTPPTALFVDEVAVFTAVCQFLAQRRLRVPQDVSLICSEWDPSFALCSVPVSHLTWDSRPLIRRAVRWATNVSLGKKDVQQSITPEEFVPGGTIGPVRKVL